LEKDGGYCCLGVLCEISKLGRFKKISEDGAEKGYWVEGDYALGTLPGGVVQWAEMKSGDGGHVDHTGTPLSLTALNDNMDKSFSEIADHIAENWERL
jgi:hypothetical protein